MRTRPFGRLGWPVSEIGLGTWGMGGMWGAVDDREAIRAIRRALELGVSFLDTAAVYGEGHAEELIRQALAGRDEAVCIATKVPPKNMEWPARHEALAAEAFPAGWIIEQTEASLRRLGRAAVELQQLHVWAPRWLKEQEVWLPAIERLKREGKIKAFGISINDHEPDTALEAVASGLIDSVQVIYNVFDQTPAERLLPACQQCCVGVIVRVPFDEGSLTGTLTAATRFAPDDWRGTYFAGERLRETVERVEPLKALSGAMRRTLPQAALAFCLAHPAVSTVIPGMRRVAHVEENCAVAEMPPLSAVQLGALRGQAWPRNYYAGVFSD
ncbi:MAG: aldo/keto reductase [Candidatus Omnitrophica bacterium]|nr:aldo/keto reductase [Candidatus Omnitrophota bacterium]